MSKQSVLESLICANCDHMVTLSENGKPCYVCNISTRSTHLHAPFCPDFDGQPIQWTGKREKRIVDDGSNYHVV